MYQRAFANAKGAVRVVALDGSQDFTTGMKNAFVEGDYYTLSGPDGQQEHALVERELYAEVESAVDATLRSLVAGRFPVSIDERVAFAEFMALQVTRGPHFRKFADHMGEQLGKALQMGMAMTPAQHWERKRAEWQADPEAGPEPPGPFTAEQADRLARGDLLTLRPSKGHTIRMSLVAVEQMTTIFSLMDWTIVAFPVSSLFTAPLPVTYWRKPFRGHEHYGIGPVTADEVLLPLSPRRALLLTHPARKPQLESVMSRDQTMPGREETARHINWLTLEWNDQLLLSPDVKRHPVPVTPAQLDGARASGVRPRLHRLLVHGEMA